MSKKGHKKSPKRVSPEWSVLGFYLRVDTTPGIAQAYLFDIDDLNETNVLGEAKADTPDAAVQILFDSLSIYPQDEDVPTQNR